LVSVVVDAVERASAESIASALGLGDAYRAEPRAHKKQIVARREKSARGEYKLRMNDMEPA
jgi:hypothetical protein